MVQHFEVEFSKSVFSKNVKKCFLKKLSVWLALIKVSVWGINFKNRQCIYKGVYFILKSRL